MDRHHPGAPQGDTEEAMLWDQIPFPRCRPGGGPGGCRNCGGALPSRQERRGEALAASAAAGALRHPPGLPGTGCWRGMLSPGRGHGGWMWLVQVTRRRSVGDLGHLLASAQGLRGEHGQRDAQCIFPSTQNVKRTFPRLPITVPGVRPRDTPSSSLRSAPLPSF